MSYFKIDLDKTLGQYVFYKDGSLTPIVTVPYLAYGLPFVFIDENFSVAYCSENGIDIIYHFADYTTITNYKFDFSGVFDSVLAGSYLDLGIWDNAYNLDLFYATKNIYEAFQSLNETYLTFDTITAVATGSTYTIPVVPFSYDVKIVFDEINSLCKWYYDGVFIKDVPYGADYTNPLNIIDDKFSLTCSNSWVNIVFLDTALSNIKLYKFDFSSVSDKIEIGTNIDVSIWDIGYNAELFVYTVDALGVIESLNQTNLTFDTVTSIATGLNYVVPVVPPVASSCDLSVLTIDFDEIDLSLASLDDKVNSAHQKLDYLITLLQQTYTFCGTLSTKTDLSLITFDTTDLATKTDISTLSHYDVTNIVLPSLNGNGSEYKDGVQVTIFGRATVYTVERSFISLYSDNGYTVHYDLVSVDGYKCTVPEALLTKYVEVV